MSVIIRVENIPIVFVGSFTTTNADSSEIPTCSNKPHSTAGLRLLLQHREVIYKISIHKVNLPPSHTQTFNLGKLYKNKCCPSQS